MPTVDRHNLLNRCLAVIPARYASSRFPGKPLAMLGERPVLQYAYERARKVFPHVVIATDDARIEQAVEKWGGRCVLTSPACESGTARCAEVLQTCTDEPLWVVNIQGDEPFLCAEHFEALLSGMATTSADVVTLVCPFAEGTAYEDIASPNAVKVVVGADGRALYFSRSPIPFVRDMEHSAWSTAFPFLRHIGLYAYTAQSLRRISLLPKSPLEQAEKLEQLRWLSGGLTIQTVCVSRPTIDINTPEDLLRATQYLADSSH